MPLWSQKKVPITFPTEDVTLNFFITRDPLCFHSIDSCFIVIHIWYIHVSSPHMIHRIIDGSQKQSVRNSSTEALLFIR